MEAANNTFERVFHKKLAEKRMRVILSVLSSVLRSVLTLLPTLIMRDIYNGLEAGEGAGGLIWACIATFIIPMIVSLLFTYDIKVSKYIFVIIREIRSRALENTVMQRLNKILRLNKSDLFSRIIESLERLGDFYYYTMNTSVWYLTSCVVGVALMLFINIRIAPVLLVFSALQVFCSVLLQKRIRGVQERENELFAEGADYVRRVVQNNAYIKTARLAPEEMNKAKVWNSSVWGNTKARIWNEQGTALLAFILATLRSLYLFFAAYFLLSREAMLIGDFIALNSYVVWLTPVFAGLQESVEDIIAATAHKKRVNLLVEEEQNMEDAGLLLEGGFNSLVARGLSFAFEKGGAEVFSGISLDAQYGDRLFIVGASGSGKSTLLNVLSGLDDRYEGSICINGRDLRKIDPQWLHRNLLIVGQDADVLPTTLRENLLYSGRQMSDAQLKEVLAALNLSYLLDMPGGLDWDMVEHPRTLSDGERKRLSIARAVIAQPRALLLDEPTAGLDNITKTQMMDYLKATCVGLLVIVTHDAIYHNADNVLRMEQFTARN